VRAIYFDLDGTLLHLARPYRDVLAGAFEAVAGEVREGWLDAYDEAFLDLFRACEPSPVRRAFAAVDCGGDPDALVAALRDREVEACRPPGNAGADLARLAETHRLGVLTNGVPEWQRRKLRENGLAGHFDAVVASYDVGAHKPDAAPFRAAEDRLPADAYAMVGDADADVDGARAAGWTAHRYDGGGFGDLPGAIEWA
jgi:putative hydrolase of the HAD superfamily